MPRPLKKARIGNIVVYSQCAVAAESGKQAIADVATDGRRGIAAYYQCAGGDVHCAAEDLKGPRRFFNARHYFKSYGIDIA